MHSNRGFAGKDMDLVRPKWMLLRHIAFILIVIESPTGPGRVMEASRAPTSIPSLVCPKLLGWIWNHFAGGQVIICKMGSCEGVTTEESHPNLFANILGFWLLFDYSTSTSYCLQMRWLDEHQVVERAGPG